jgi:hypothetical protein
MYVYVYVTVVYLFLLPTHNATTDIYVSKSKYTNLI